MTRAILTVAGLCLMAAALPPSAGAQTFKVEKFDIKGDGGTDYVAVEPASGRVFVSRSTHMRVRCAPKTLLARESDRSRFAGITRHHLADSKQCWSARRAVFA